MSNPETRQKSLFSNLGYIRLYVFLNWCKEKSTYISSMYIKKIIYFLLFLPLSHSHLLSIDLCLFFLPSLSFLLLSSKSRMSSSQSKFSRGSQVFSSLEGEDETQTNKRTGVNHFVLCMGFRLWLWVIRLTINNMQFSQVFLSPEKKAA